MVIFDCERMKYPNTGLYVYCDNVASCLVRQKDKINDSLCLFVPSGIAGRWGDGVSYRKLAFSDRYFLHCGKSVRIWHSSHQQTAYVPPAGVMQVLTVHDLNFLYEKPLRKHRAYLSALQKQIDRADYIVTISESTRRDLMDNIDVKEKPVEVVYNGLNQFDGDIVPPVSRPSGPFLFSVGTVLPKKNFHVLPALLKGTDYSLIIAGNRSPYEKKIMEEAARYGVEDRVFIIGPVTEAVKYWYIKHCEAFLFPSVAEGFGLPVIEAMYYQKPIFLSDRTSLPEIGGNHVFYFDHDFDPDTMTVQFRRGMELFANGNVDCGLMRQHALGFSWERTARRYIGIYNTLLSSVSRAASRPSGKSE